MKVRIQNDGQSSSMTRVTDAETGETIEGVARIELVMEPKPTPVQAVLTLYPSQVDVIAEAEIKRICPYCGKTLKE